MPQREYLLFNGKTLLPFQVHPIVIFAEVINVCEAVISAGIHEIHLRAMHPVVLRLSEKNLPHFNEDEGQISGLVA